MRAVVMAVGLGKRLGAPIHKTLTVIDGGSSILDLMVLELRQAGCEVFVVVRPNDSRLATWSLQQLDGVHVVEQPIEPYGNTLARMTVGVDSVLAVDCDIVGATGVFAHVSVEGEAPARIAVTRTPMTMDPRAIWYEPALRRLVRHPAQPPALGLHTCGLYRLSGEAVSILHHAAKEPIGHFFSFLDSLRNCAEYPEVSYAVNVNTGDQVIEARDPGRRVNSPPILHIWPGRSI